MELVTEPVIHDAKTAGNFARELQLILRTLGISHANMEKGEMRVEANISVSKEEGVLGTKVEVKNLNSFKSVESAIEYEVSRQIECLENGKELSQETRGWDEVKLRTFVQRTKETAKDYRYFPDPDIPKIKVSEYASFDTSRLDEIIPKLPHETRLFYENLGITSNTIEVLLSNLELDNFLKQVLDLSKDKDVAKLAANYLTSDLLPILAEESNKLEDLKPAHFSELMAMVEEGQIGSRVAKDMLKDLFGSQKTPLQIATDSNLLQMSDSSSLEPIIAEIIKENESVVNEYREGKNASMQFLVGQGMKKTKGSANPTLLKEMLDKAIK
jgi:aspartyl-tRNA(Asn)/glutamyl-tRNA(Gln) amidotransferase subunit B